MYQQQPAHPPAGGGALALTLRYHPVTFLLALFTPVVQVDGHRVGHAWGRIVVPLAPGQHHVHVHVPYLLPTRIGAADLGVAVHPGQTVELEYRAPMIAFFGGALGAPPQKYPGMVGTVVLAVVTLVILLCLCGGVILAAGDGTSTARGLPGLDVVAPAISGLWRS
ncbi:hypothetical protein [Couchioplanes azureus]|uniref:hypothetical protein n=1 Tax=Couchioplanes caeruleus TaxID=56438 RepID=UPI001670CAAC|nr:hypothetical protein [Couchioplanes caeruleus]GGQ81301.1 hypothetical protein GCM10010166_59290 [Couchioplanes caeruleus subsp. azureus]